MTTHGKGLLEDGKGISSAATAALLSIVVIIGLPLVIGASGRTEALFVTIFEFIKPWDKIDLKLEKEYRLINS